MTLTIVGISGKLTSGKTTLANALIAAEPSFVRCALADALKDDVAEMCEVTRGYLNEHKGEFREILQVYGVLMRSLHGEDYWVRRLEDAIWDNGYTHVIVDDVRFPNELAGVRKMGRALTVRLNITDSEQARRFHATYGAAPSPEKLAHISETALDNRLADFDLNIDAEMPTARQVRVVLDMLRAPHVLYAAASGGSGK